MSTSTAMNAYGREAVLTASPAALLVMLCDRLVLDVKRAELAQTEGRWVDAHNDLVHAQDILAELMRSLDVEAWDGAEQLLATYAYIHQTLVAANIRRSVELTREALEFVEPLARTWHEAAQQVAAPSGGSGVG